jgi:serine/threonine protein kinase
VNYFKPYCSLSVNSSIFFRNLRPEGLQLTNDSYNAQLKIIDFSTAIQNQNLLEKGNHLLPYYKSERCFLAPELFSPGSSYSEATDMWAFGALVYLIIFGHLPTVPSPENDSSVVNFRLSVDESSSLSEEAVDFLQQCFDIDPVERITSGVALSHPWFEMEDWQLESHYLTNTILVLKRFQIRRKLRVRIQALVWIIRVQRIIRENKQNQLRNEEWLRSDTSSSSDIHQSDLEYHRFAERENSYTSGCILS